MKGALVLICHKKCKTAINNIATFIFEIISNILGIYWTHGLLILLIVIQYLFIALTLCQFLILISKFYQVFINIPIVIACTNYVYLTIKKPQVS